MSVTPYDAAFAAELNRLAEVYYACRETFRAVAQQSEWRPGKGSPAESDTKLFSTHDPPYPDGTQWLLSLTPYFYLSAASEHLGALGALYTQREVLIPPATLIRAVVEHCARVLWLLQREPLRESWWPDRLGGLGDVNEQEVSSGGS